MDNLTHSLVGAALAELALPADASRSRRRLFFVAGIVAANLPDADLLYTRISPEPLGYLLHHRGHTHTVVGLVGQGLLVALVCLLPALRRTIAPVRGRFAALVGMALASHLVLDSWNSYGLHPFWPADNRWFYGDAIFILEPWVWLPLGVAAALNTQRRRGGMVLGAAIATMVAVLAAIRMIPVAAAVALAVAGVIGVVALRRRAPRWRSAAALAMVALFVAGMFAVRERARGTLVAALPAAERALTVDLVLNPSPANPLCWSGIGIARDEALGEYRLTRGFASPLLPTGCGRAAAVGWAAPVRRPLARLRDLAARDCRVRSWLQFGRAPDLDATSISDMRFSNRGRENFSTMPLLPPVDGCPPNLTAWELPRADLLR